MTTTELLQYFKGLFFKAKGVNPSRVDENLIKQAIAMGLSDFCGAYNWAFREIHDTITTTESSETVDLPSDFVGIVSLREHTSSSGYMLRHVGADEYDRTIPDSTALNEGTPKMYKVYYDDNEGVWRVALYPTPDAAITLYLSYHSLGVTVPEKYVGGITAAVAKHLAYPGSTEWMSANNAMLMEIERLKVVDNIGVGTISKVHDSSDEPTSWDFIEYMRVGQG